MLLLKETALGYCSQKHPMTLLHFEYTTAASIIPVFNRSLTECTNMHFAECLHTKCWNRLASGGTSCPPRCVFPWLAWTWRPMSSRGVKAWRTWTQEPGRSLGSSLQANSSSLRIWSFPSTTCMTCTLCVTTTEECTEDIIQVKCCLQKDIADIRILSADIWESWGRDWSKRVLNCQTTTWAKTFETCPWNLLSVLNRPAYMPFCARVFSSSFRFDHFWYVAAGRAPWKT